MRLSLRTLIGLLALLLTATACRELAETREPFVSATIAPITLTPEPTPTPAPAQTPTATPSDLWIEPADVRIHPDGGLYSGDLVSFEITAHNGTAQDASQATVAVDWGNSGATGEIPYLPAGGSGSTTMTWVWNTAGLVGERTITLTLDPEGKLDDPDRANNVVGVTVDLGAKLPDNEASAVWRTSTSACCIYHFISGTAAARDIDQVMKTADEAIGFVEERLGVERTRKMDIYLLDRVLGHGGFAGEHVAITYIDRDYAGGGLLEVFRHEGAHMLDRQIAKGERPALLVEGFAVYVTGGHFKLEPLAERAAALTQIGAYIPLRELANEFYPRQHETGYLEGGAFIDYLVRRNGYQTFIDLYDDIARKPGELDADMIDRQMEAMYGVGLDEMEAEWLNYLRTIDPSSEVRDLRNTIAFYDTVRRYQKALDPSAYFLQAWIPDVEEAESRGIVSDFMRHPRAADNIALESMLVAADKAFGARDFDRVETLLASVNVVLDAGVTFADPLAAHYLAVVESALAFGYEPQRIDLDGDRAAVIATRGGDATQIRLSASLQNGVWLLGSNQ